MPPVVEAEKEAATSKLFSDVVNVSEGFQLRTVYKKKVKPSKLDGLLERRVKQFTLEEKQRLERMRQAALLIKMGAAKHGAGVKAEGSVSSKQQPPCVKAEEKAADTVVKKLDFEEDSKMDNLDVKPDTTVPSKQTEVNTHKEVNGGTSESTGLNSKNSISDTIENEENAEKPEVAQVGENPKKRAYEEMEPGSGQNDSESTDQSKTSPVQVNGRTQLTADPPKEAVRSLMNGNLSQNDISHPPPLKVPKLENHIGEKVESVSKNEDVNSERANTAKPQSTSPSRQNSNSTDNCTSTTESQNALTPNTSSSVCKPDVTSPAASSTAPVAAQLSSSTPAPSQKTKPPVNETKSNSSGSMTISKEYSTRDRVSLLKFSKSKKARSGTALPSFRKFVTKSSKKSIFVLPNDDLKRMARKAGIREVPIFNYNAKPALDIWPYPSPRPTFGITWRFV